MTQQRTIEGRVHGMDCAEYTQHVQHAIAALSGVASVNVFSSSEKAVIQLDPARVDIGAIRKAVAGACYSVPAGEKPAAPSALTDFTRPVLTLFGVVFSAVLFIVVFGESLVSRNMLTASQALEYEQVEIPQGVTDD